MQIANVIVDVPAMQTDRTFDYLIPEKWEGSIMPGMRVIVPFGPRKIQGYVTGIKSSSDFSKLKQIEEPLDLYPVLNEELLELGRWLTEKTLSFKVSVYQAMLPAAMKAKYEKIISVIHPEKISKELIGLFNGKQEINWKDIEDQNLLKLIQQEAKHQNVEIIYEVKSKARKKTIREISCRVDGKELNEYMESLPSNAVKQKELLKLFTDDPSTFMPIQEIYEKSGASAATVRTLVEKGILIEQQKEVYRDPFENREFKKTSPFSLTYEQTEAIKPILASIEENLHKTFLLYGVTGSGKTEVYLQSIQRVLDKGKEAIVLVPEISLTPQMVNRFKGRFGHKVAVLHSGLSIGEKYDEWRKILRKEVSVVVGARSAIFAPFENLGIVIIDEEHETSYKQEENPRYHARDVAIHRGQHHNCPIILGSATPSLETFARAQKNVYEKLTLSKRMNQGELPHVEIVDMREELRNGNRSMFSTELFEKLEDRLNKKEQSVLFLNKRGHSSFIMCRDCGLVVQCPHCDISMTYHRYSEQLKCHYCSYEERVPSICPECSSEHIRYFGTGTQKVEEELAKLLPEARVIRMDVDTTSRKGSHEKLLRQFEEGKADILLGTQMIAKGLDFPNITLVGVLSADTMLHLPDFRASEKTFQLLTQVSGRAGRHELEGEVVIQTYTPEHYSIQLAGEQDYDKFYNQEMMMRKTGGYPPFYFLGIVNISHEDLMKTVQTAEKITSYIRSRLSDQAVILGPSSSPIARINNRYRYQCLIKYKREPGLTETLKNVIEHYQSQSSDGLIISADMNPYMLM
ncbi:primosomal protein N' [Falsibacillus pallidus]|uniref:Replication restart protein PriA n=1 Tax=Falsibacillus pallidus TaxID=493781 RepID=A0A370GW81_9BACI|nr:primosomal protein N' [Falsibacillus pallidus]RDI47510.1 replication restart DNA helicase PriA [Falsibacillus pallidus]